MKLKGKIQRILPMQSGTSKNNGMQWQKVEFIVEESRESYPDIICITAFNDKVSELVGYNAGDEVEVDFNCRCNEYNGRVFNSLLLFKITKVEQQAPQPPAQTQSPMQASDPGDDLPF